MTQELLTPELSLEELDSLEIIELPERELMTRCRSRCGGGDTFIKASFNVVSVHDNNVALNILSVNNQGNGW